jgi:flagellar hook-length control protein FliK
MTVTMLDSLPVPTAPARPNGAAKGARRGAADFNALVETAVKARSAPPRRAAAQGEGKDLPGTEGKAKKAVREADTPPAAAPDAAAAAPAAPLPVIPPVPAQVDPTPAPETKADGNGRSASPAIVLPAQASSRASVAAPASPAPAPAPVAPAPAPVAPEIAAAAPPVPLSQASGAPVDIPAEADAAPAAPSEAPVSREMAAQLAVSIDALPKGAASVKQASASSPKAGLVVADAPVPVIEPAEKAQVSGVESVETASLPASDAPIETPIETPIVAERIAKATLPARRGMDVSPQSPDIDKGRAERSDAVRQIVQAMVPPAQVVRVAQAAGGKPVPAAPANPVGQVAAPSTDSAPAPVAEATALLGLVADTMQPEEPGGREVRASPVASVALGKVTPGRRGNVETPRLDGQALAAAVSGAKPQDAAAGAVSQIANADPAMIGAAITPSAQVASDLPAPAAQGLTGAGIPAAPDLGASLGRSVVDIASGNQWLDGLAREISGVAASGGQGSFRLSPQHLGDMRVDIRDGALGTEAAITVKSEAARAALAAEADLARPDPRSPDPQSTVRIADIRVDRTASVADAGRSDMGGQSTAGQGGWNQGHGQSALAQGSGQGSGQGGAQGQHRGQAAIKVSPEVTVLGSGDPQDQRGERGGQNGRGARYA